MNEKMVNKNDLIKLEFTKWQSEDLIRRAKRQMVTKGFAYYENKRLGVVPAKAVKELLGLDMTEKNEVGVIA